jgi:hypothetical protein
MWCDLRRPARPLLVAWLGAAVLLGACGGGPAAFAAGTWTRPVSGRVLVAYGESCPGSGSSGTRTHQGVDFACAAGETAVACEGGTVTFAGPVPGDSGGRVTAVTVTGDDGLRVTYMPLATSAVVAGRRVDAGSPIGGVSGEGDSSSAATHLHLSVRRGESYLDPAGMLAEASGGASGGGAGGAPGPGSANGGPSPGPAAPDPAPPAGSPDAAGSSSAHAGASAGQASAAVRTPVTAPSAAAAPSVAQAGALASLAALRAAPVVSPAAAVRAVTSRVSLLRPTQARAAMPVPMPHATGLAAMAGSVSSLERAATVAAAALAVALAALAFSWKSLYRAAGTAASAVASRALAPASTTPQRRA